MNIDFIFLILYIYNVYTSILKNINVEFLFYLFFTLNYYLFFI